MTGRDDQEAVMRDIRQGMIVRTPDGEKLGKIASVLGDEFMIEKGLLFKHDYKARCDRIVEIGDDEITYEPISAEEREGTPAVQSEAIEASEEITVTKRPAVREEVRMRKQKVQERRVASAEVRHEEAEVEDLSTGERPLVSTTEPSGGMRAPGRDDEVK
jgi:uncharacterized protein YrrD